METGGLWTIDQYGQQMGSFYPTGILRKGLIDHLVNGYIGYYTTTLKIFLFKERNKCLYFVS